MTMTLIQVGIEHYGFLFQYSNIQVLIFLILQMAFLKYKICQMLLKLSMKQNLLVLDRQQWTVIVLGIETKQFPMRQAQLN